MRDNPFLDATVGGILAAAAARFPDREAVVATDTRISYAGLYAGACRVARALLALGIGKDDKVAVWLPNRPAGLFAAQHGCALIGAVAVVSPGQIEAFLMTHPDVLQAFVIGVPDVRTNEAAVAYVIPRPGAALVEDALIAHCRGRIASFKVPRHVRIVADVPRTPGPHGDKVQKGKLRELFLGESAGSAARPERRGA